MIKKKSYSIFSPEALHPSKKTVWFPIYSLLQKHSLFGKD